MLTGSTVRHGCAALAVAIAVSHGIALLASSHLRLVNEGSSGPLYECDTAACAPARSDNPARQNLDQMDFYVLPGGCVALASLVVRPEGPGVDVECGAPGASSHYRCESLSCRLLDPAAANAGAATQTIALPAACGGRIHEVIVVGATTGTPAAFVECDASSSPVLNP